MKREYTPTPSPIPPSAGISPSAGDNDVITPVTPPKKQRKTPAKPSPAKTFSTSSQGSTAGDSPTGWTADTREALIAKVITLGLKACKPDDLATEFGLSKTQLNNVMQQGKPGNLRGRLLKAARAEAGQPKA